MRRNLLLRAMAQPIGMAMKLPSNMTRQRLVLECSRSIAFLDPVVRSPLDGVQISPRGGGGREGILADPPSFEHPGRAEALVAPTQRIERFHLRSPLISG
jgi:hypothetical protein